MLGPLKRFSRSNGDRKEAVDGLHSMASFQRALEKERYRSDRSDSLYSLLVLALPTGNRSNGDLQRIVRRIRKRIRSIDEIGWYDQERLGIILPYTLRDGAEKLAEEICRIITPCFNSDACMECEIFCYAPDAAAQASDD